MVDILDEAIDDIKQERYQKLFFKYGKYLLVAVVTTLALSFMYLWWKSYNENKIYAEGSRYMVAALKLQTQDFQKGVDMLKEASKGETSYAALASFNFASSSLLKKQLDEAEKTFQTIGENKHFPVLFRDFAKLQYLLTAFNKERMPSNEIIKELEDYANSQSLFKYNALEQLSAVYIETGKKKEAQQTLDIIVTSSEAPEALKQRAQQLMLLVSK